MKEFIYKNRGYIYFIGFIGILYLIILPFYNRYDSKKRLELFEKGIYYVAQITDFRKEVQSWHYRYEFIYKGKKYNARSYYKGINLEVGKKYFLLVNPENPNFNVLLQPCPFPDSIKEIPSDGWKDPPIQLNTENILIFLKGNPENQ